MQTKRFADRLAELERLEAAAHQVEDDRPLDETDADELDDDEVLEEATYGLGAGRALTCWNEGRFRTTFTNPALGFFYWRRIAERALALCDARGIVLFPMTPEEICAAIDMVERGVLQIRSRPPQTQYSHRSCIQHGDYGNAAAWGVLFQQKSKLADALDDWLWQRRRLMGEAAVLCETAGAVLDVLRRALGDDNEPTA
ncbi:MAG TPA: hypothetical protein VGJ87_03230 [Roseiflexaceae bacterium]|jgi:hypothetical protein